MTETKETPQLTPLPPTFKFYKKELFSNRLSLPNGKKVAFEQVGNSDTGIIATSDPGLSAELDKAVAARRGGVIEINEAQFQELKKNPPAGRSPIKSLNAQSLRQLLSSPAPDRSAVAADVKVEPSAPMEVPKGLATISSRRKLAELTAKAQTSPPNA